MKKILLPCINSKDSVTAAHIPKEGDVCLQTTACCKEEIPLSLGHKLCRESLSSHEIGKLGEEYACTTLKNRGWTILERNFRTRYGELDIIARDPHDNLCCIEVKTRRSLTCGKGEESVTPQKQQHLRLALLYWLSSQQNYRSEKVRCDVLSIVIEHSKITIHLFKGAF